MSASERLRALDGAMTHEFVVESRQREALELIVALRNALPLIADVVEAAEDFAAWPDQESPDGPALAAALTALAEHLEGGDE